LRAAKESRIAGGHLPTDPLASTASGEDLLAAAGLLSSLLAAEEHISIAGNVGLQFVEVIKSMMLMIVRGR
jgi:hypothetical protein